MTARLVPIKSAHESNCSSFPQILNLPFRNLENPCTIAHNATILDFQQFYRICLLSFDVECAYCQSFWSAGKKGLSGLPITKTCQSLNICTYLHHRSYLNSYLLLWYLSFTRGLQCTLFIFSCAPGIYGMVVYGHFCAYIYGWGVHSYF